MLKVPAVLLAVPAVVMLAGGAFAQASPTLKKIQDRGAIVIGHRDAAVPFSYIDQNQKPIGFPAARPSARHSKDCSLTSATTGSTSWSSTR